MARQFKHLNRKQEETSTKQENKQHSTNEAAPKAVRELSAMGGKSGTRKAGSPDSLQSENPGTKEERKSEREKEGAELKDESQNKRGEERADQKEGG